MSTEPTLAKKISTILDAEIILEMGNSNPFLNLYISNPEKFSIPMQLQFLLDRFKQYAIEIPEIIKKKTVISDSLFERDWIFAHLGLNKEHILIYEQIYYLLKDQVYKPDLVIYLQGNVYTLFKRIKNRGDDTENVWTFDFIEKLNCIYEDFFKNYDTSPVLTIDIDKCDFLTSENDLNELLKNIDGILSLYKKA